MIDATQQSTPATIKLGRDNETLVVELTGSWRLGSNLPSPSHIEESLHGGDPINRIVYRSGEVDQWDTSLVSFLLNVERDCESRGISVDRSGLPEGAVRLIALATSVAEREGARRGYTGVSVLERIGTATTGVIAAGGDLLDFVGETFLGFMRLFTGKARFRKDDLMLFLQEAGAEALPIVSLISFLIGLILAFVGAVQLQQFGATIYVANIVGLGITREMGAMMTAIIMTGRMGASYAAQLGTMTVNEEIDALQTLGISPIDFLITPRMLALAIMMPLLTLYSDFVGIIGGAFIGTTMMGLPFTQYFQQTVAALGPVDFALGLFKAVVYGVLVALAGCYRGMRCGRSASAVGTAVTSAVGLGIVFVIVASALLTVLYSIVGL